MAPSALVRLQRAQRFAGFNFVSTLESSTIKNLTNYLTVANPLEQVQQALYMKQMVVHELAMHEICIPPPVDQI